MKRCLSSALGIVVVIALMLGMKFYNKGQAGKDVKAQAVQVVQTLPGYAKEPAYYDSLLEAAHPTAFDAAYEMGGRRQSAKFDAERYLDALLDGMTAKAAADKRTDVAQAITLARKTQEAPPSAQAE